VRLWGRGEEGGGANPVWYTVTCMFFHSMYVERKTYYDIGIYYHRSNSNGAAHLNAYKKQGCPTVLHVTGKVFAKGWGGGGEGGRGARTSLLW
jgi:hypothetical protein